jgi:hypothetical protein
VTAPLPGSATSSRSFATAPGTLFASSPRPVASGAVTGGRKKEETRVRLLHVSDPREGCGGVRIWTF